ncbi:hypothetical protein [Haloarchaeobius iranensis]|uniref:Uncharacterized protein n=1 Tax=Haloarchaeobius iranensis TaxID=996166 RepID=A0A1H0C0F1_9EURY|nr:hypothetical protein [Haloarchaeobius iranensis]SDN51305.1 hypothetical protein SAMN05192554_1523 [Haloarchaeobius iranensis]
MRPKQSTPVDKGAETKITTRRRYLKGTLGAAATVAAIPALSGVAAAHFPLELEIDVQPENAENFIDVSEHDSVSVAVHPSEFLNGDGERKTFDPTDEPVRYRFGSRSTVEDGAGAQPEDDGEVREFDSHHGGSHEALVLTFPVDEMGFDGGEETAWLYWERDEAGEHGYAGMDSVNIYGTETTDQDFLDLLRRLLSQRPPSPES